MVESLVFTAENWNIAQTVTVSAVDDAIDQIDPQTSVISHDASGGGYDTVTITNVSVSFNTHLQLRRLSRFRLSLSDHIGDTKRRIVVLLDIIFPEYEVSFQMPSFSALAKYWQRHLHHKNLLTLT